MKVWIARDEDKAAETWIFADKPVQNESFVPLVYRCVVHRPIFEGFEMSKRQVREVFGRQLRKGQCIECNLTLTRAD